ncbi:MAG: hypothetical protein FGM55_16470, partial [Rhodoferax sp.]|nr:hypothetical protein [Rhodoferax sp.]
RFAAVASACICLPASAGAVQARAFLDGVDLVYVGGGHTVRLVTHWRSSGLDALLGAALRRGVLMAGVSAGASAWFERFLTDSVGQGLQTASGIGLMPGSCCPHYSTEPLRPPAFTAAIGRGDLPPGLAIDDGAAVLLGPQDSPTVFSARPGARAYRVERDGDGVRSVALPSAR